MERLTLGFWGGTFFDSIAFERSVCELKNHFDMFIDCKRVKFNSDRLACPTHARAE